MIRRRSMEILTLLMLVAGAFLLPNSVHADEGPPPSPITVTQRVSNDDFMPNAVVPGPAGNQVTITNRYYPYWQGKVRTDGYASANFNLPAWRRMTCQSHARNDAGQTGTYGSSAGSYGGNSCPTTTPLAEVGGLVPANYTTWTKAWWHWSTDTQGYGVAEQTHYVQ